jgi:multiple sugar transport system substrate-binding protein
LFMKNFLFVLILLCTALFLSACGATVEEPDEPDDEQIFIYRPSLPVPPSAAPLGVPIPGFVPAERAVVTIDFFHAFHGVRRTALREIIDAFHDYQPYVRINEVVFSDRPRLEAELARRERLGSLPHIAPLSPSEVTFYRFERVLLPLNPFMDDPHVGIGVDVIGDIFDVFRAGSVYGGTWYSLPFTQHILVMYYQRDLLEARSLAPPATWEDVLRIAPAAGLEIAVGYDTLFASLLRQRGGEYINYTSGSAAFASPEGFAAMETLTNLVTIANQNNPNPALLIGTSAQQPAGAWRSAPLPGTRGNHAAEFGGDALVLFENVRHSIDERVGAWEFLRFMLKPEIAADWAIASSTLPVTRSAAMLPRSRAHLIATPQARAGEESLENGFWRTRHGYADAVNAILLEEMPAIFARTVTAEVGLTRAELRATMALAGTN